MALDMALDSALEQDLVNVTDLAAIEAAKTMGQGDRTGSDHAAVEAMRSRLDSVQIDGRIVIGEGERDEAPMLFVGERVGAAEGAPGVDIAVDPLEGTNLCASGGPGAVAVLAAAERGGLLHAPDIYMDKLVVGPTAKGTVHLDAPVADNLENIARAFDRRVSDLVVVVLERERHNDLIEEIRTAGARIRLIGDGDLSAAVSAAVRGSGIHAVMGIGGAPEGVITAAAMRCLGGEIQARLVAMSDKHRQRLADLEIHDENRLYSTEDLAPGENIVFTCTGVTTGELLEGVRFFGGGSRTHTLFMSMPRKLIRFVDSIHRESLSTPVQLS